MQQVSLTGKKAPQNEDVENSTSNQEDEKKVQQSPRKTLKYYFNRLRYYHYCIAEKLDTLIGAVCIALIKIYLFLTGWNKQLATQDDGMISMLDIDDE